MTGRLSCKSTTPGGRRIRQTADDCTVGKTVLTDIGAVDPASPQNRNRTFAPQIVRKGANQAGGANRRIITPDDQERYPVVPNDADGSQRSDQQHNVRVAPGAGKVQVSEQPRRSGYRLQDRVPVVSRAARDMLD